VKSAGEDFAGAGDLFNSGGKDVADGGEVLNSGGKDSNFAG
jgi:hypothetical protein